MKNVASLFILTVILGCQDKDPTPVSMPDCIQQVIEHIKKEAIWNPPAKVFRYDYKGQEVYYISARCCDIPSLVIAGCDTLCMPDGGFPGKGDGRCVDFAKEAKNPVLVWQDERTK